MEENNYNPDLITIVDENNKEHVFEELDRIEDDYGKYVALTPALDGTDEIIDSDGELIILKVSEDESGETWLSYIEDEVEFDRISKVFEERLSDYYEIEE